MFYIISYQKRLYLASQAVLGSEAASAGHDDPGQGQERASQAAHRLLAGDEDPQYAHEEWR
jgi:hypothetical protein